MICQTNPLANNTFKVSVSYHEIDPSTNPLNALSLEKWLTQVIRAEGFSLDELDLILCLDTYLLDLNKKYLDHDTLTDIITFDYSSNEAIRGECYISAQRIEENAQRYAVSKRDELHRVIVHGVLHLCGYGDKSDQEKEIMRAKEEMYLALRN